MKDEEIMRNPLKTGMGTVSRYAVLIAFFSVTAYPLFWMLGSALRTEGALQRAPFALPFQPYWGNLTDVLFRSGFPHAYLNSLAVCSVSVMLSLAASAFAAFAFAQMRFRLRQVLFLLLLAGMVIPVHVTLIPLNHLMGGNALNLKDTLWALIGPYVGFALPISVIILRTSFTAIPSELLEAARMDGCGPWRTFWHIAVPLVRPAIATVVIFNFLTMWNEFAFALTLLRPDNPTLPLAIAQFKGEHDIEVARSCAALAVAVVPLLVVYLFAQKQIIRGLTAGAVKE